MDSIAAFDQFLRSYQANKGKRPTQVILDPRDWFSLYKELESRVYHEGIVSLDDLPYEDLSKQVMPGYRHMGELFGVTIWVQGDKVE